MPSIAWILDVAEPGTVDAIDPLGRIVIRGDRGAGDEIEDKCTNIDVFLLGLTKLMATLHNSESAQADLVIEPDPLIAERLEDSGLRLSYGSQSVVVEDSEQFKEVLGDAVCRFLAEFPAATEVSASVAELRRYVASRLG